MFPAQPDSILPLFREIIPRRNGHIAGLTANLDTDVGCTIQEISRSGLGLVSDRKYSIGQILNVTLHFVGEDFSGQMVIEWMRQLDGDRTQYGLRGLFDAKGSDMLRIGRMRFTRAVHRQNLQRVSGGDHGRAGQ